MVKVKLLSQSAKVPTRSNTTDAGWDLYASKTDAIMRSCRKLVSTDIAMEIPEGCVGLIWPRSGLSVKNGIAVLAGVVDSGYRGEIKVCLLNTSESTFMIEPGDRIAQMLIQKVEDVDFAEVENLDEADRGDSGFGSTGR
tara:strand:- start:288 stop:707 length:420 start_codon:yes stop_codon:yes gene_type:complete